MEHPRRGKLDTCKIFFPELDCE